LDKKYNDLCTFKKALTAIDKSENLRKMLQIVLAFGNFLHADTSHGNSEVRYGVYGFHLDSLITLKTVKSQDNESFTLLTYIYSYCKNHFPDALKVIDELKDCHEATKLKGRELYQSIMSADEELTVFQRELRNYRDNKNKKQNEGKKKEEMSPNDQNKKFEVSMSLFNHKGRHSCQILLNTWNECTTIANRVAQEYDYEFHQNDSYEQLIRIFDEFISDLKKAGIYLETTQNKRKKVDDTHQVSTKPRKKSYRPFKNKHILIG